MSVVFKCLPQPRLGLLHLPLVISGLDNTRRLIKINLKEDNCFYQLHVDGTASLDLDFKIKLCSHLSVVSVVMYFFFERPLILEF